jgi:AAA ATPase domain
VQNRQPPLDLFVGREAELARVAEVVTLVEAGQPWLVAIEGAPGVGKTALARRCLAAAPGLTVLSARADQAETDLDFGLVDQLFRAAGGVVPPILSAESTDSAASSFAMGARLLEVLGEQQAAGPVAIVVDDLQWADRSWATRRRWIRPARRSSRRSPPAWWTGGQKSRPARSRSATRWSGTPSTPVSRPRGAVCSMPGPRPWSASRRPGPTGWPPWTGPTRPWPPSWTGWRAPDTGYRGAAAASYCRTMIAIGASQVGGPQDALAELGHLDPDPARVGLVDVDGLSFRGVLRLQTGDLGRAVRDLTASLGLSRKGATLILGLRACCYLALAQYLAGEWDDVLLTSEQGFSAAAIHSRRYELPMLHLAAGCAPTGRGEVKEAERHARLAEEAAASLDYGQERPFAAVARALVCQASGDYLGMADALGYWQDDAALDGRSRVYTMLWRPLLAEGLIGSGQTRPGGGGTGADAGRGRPGQLHAADPGLAGRMAGRAERRPRTGPGDLPARRGDGQHAKPGAHRPAAAGSWPAAAAHR